MIMKTLYFITKSNWGGAQKHVYDLAVYGKKMGYDITVALGGNGLLRDKLMEAGIPTRTINSLERNVNMKNDLLSL